MSFLPTNLPYTMPPEEAATCYKVMQPEVAVPYHQGESEAQIVFELLTPSSIDVRILDLP